MFWTDAAPMSPVKENPGSLEIIARFASAGIRRIHEDAGQPIAAGRTLDNGARILLDAFLQRLEKPTADRRRLAAFRAGYNEGR
jgi:hypothetical protein